jgi:uroporphyrinogen III methyltransferase / synthase
LIEAARAGKRVVRLKGGDPFVFGRGGEEGEALRAAGIEFEVVPGVTAGVAASAYAGIPVTHRDDASAVAFVTGHEDPEKEGTALDWEALARFPGTLVFYMGVKRLEENMAALIEAGRDADEAAAAVERGTMDGQRTVVATLSTLAEAVEREGIGAPALIVAGPVVERRESLAWLARRPLHGLRIVVTRARAQASGLAATLRDLGAEVVELPAIRIEPRIESDEVRRAIEQIGEYSLICVTSPNGAHLLFEALAEAGLDARALGGRTKKKQVGKVGTGATGQRGGSDHRGDWPRDCQGPRGAWDHRRRRPRALRRRGVGRGAGRRRGGGPQGARLPRGRGARCAPRRVAGAGGRGRRRRPLRDRARDAVA